MIAFGPVPSRRLGKSLGINNIISRKVCSYSCVYCQLGITAKKIILRENFYEPEKLIQEVGKHLKKLDPDHKPDYLTFVANGEPTLDVNLGEEIKLLKRKFNIPVAVITNASQIYNENVQNELLNADWVSVKIDSVIEATWRMINQPHILTPLTKILEGLEEFAEKFTGKLNTETMLLDNYNTAKAELEKTASFIESLQPDKSYISIPVRPPAISSVNPPSEKNLLKAHQIFEEKGLCTELLAGFEGTDTGITGNAWEDILNITAVHPLREDSMKELLIKNNADSLVVDSLIEQGVLKSLKYNGKKYYLRQYHY